MEAAKLEYQKDHELVNTLMSQGLIDVFGNTNLAMSNDTMTWLRMLSYLNFFQLNPLCQWILSVGVKTL